MIRNHLVNIEKVKKTNAHKRASRQTNRQNDRNPSRNMNIRQQKLMESDQFLFSFFHGISNDRNRISSWSSSSSFALSPRMFIELTKINDSNFFSISFWYLIVLIWNSNKMRISNSDRIFLFRFQRDTDSKWNSVIWSICFSFCWVCLHLQTS